MVGVICEVGPLLGVTVDPGPGHIVILTIETIGIAILLPEHTLVRDIFVHDWKDVILAALPLQCVVVIRG